MANELVIHYPTGATLYALLFDATGQIYNGSTFGAPLSASWTDYDIAMAEVATATGIYRASMPAVAAGAYGWVVRKQAGGSPAVGDITVGSGTIAWSGTAEIVPLAPTVAGRTLDIAAGGEVSANVTMQAGVAVAPADANGNIPVNIKTIKGSLAAVDGLAGLSEWYDAESYVAVLGQDIRDAMKLAPSAGAPAAGSVDKHLDDILAVAPDNKPTVAATGEIAADVTTWAGDPVNDLVSGEVPASLTSSSGQVIADATKLLPGAGLPAIGSVAYILPTIPTASENADAVWNEEMADHVGPTTTGGHLDLAAEAGPVGDMLESVGYHRFKTNALENVRHAVGLATANLDTQLATLALEATAQAILAVIGAGSGTGLYTDTITNGSTPLDGVRVQLSTDEAGEHRVYETFTNALGVFVLRPDPGTYYRWLDLAGITFEQGIEVEVL